MYTPGCYSYDHYAFDTPSELVLSSCCFNQSNNFLLIVFESGLSDIVIEQKDSYKDLSFASTKDRSILSSVYVALGATSIKYD